MPGVTDIEVHEQVPATPSDELLALYGDVYAGPPYFDGPADVAEFAAEWPVWRAEPGFRLVLARAAGELVGFGVGWSLPEGGWGSAERVSGFGVAELGVRGGWRGRGIASRVHAALVAGQARVLLWVRADASTARAVYARWGYRRVGEVDRDGLSYLVLCLDRG